MLNLDEEKIREALSLTKDYKIVKAPKKGGGYRTIYIPPLLLKKVQRAIIRRIFHRIWNQWWVNLWLYGVQRKTSYVNHAEMHKEADWIFQFDLKDAFPSVNVATLKDILYSRINGEMEGFGFSVGYYQNYLKREGLTDEEVAAARSRNSFFDDLKYLRQHRREMVNSAFFPLKDMLILKKEEEYFSLWEFPDREKIARGLADLIMDLTTCQGILPQGTPTAPFLFYLFLTERDLFAKLRAICPEIKPRSQDRYKFRISAYIDNFAISAQEPIPQTNRQEIIKTLEEFGLKVNPKKTRNDGTIYGAPLITGLRIIKGEKGEGKVVLPKRKVRQIRGLFHRAIFDPTLRPKVEGFINAIKPIYGIRTEWTHSDRDFAYLREKPILPPQLEKPFLKLLEQLELEEEKKKVLIRIVSTPEGTGIPEEIRKGWVGVEFRATGPVSISLRPAVGHADKPLSEKPLVYEVPAEVALQALKGKNIQAWTWFARQESIVSTFAFNADSCREIKS